VRFAAIDARDSGNAQDVAFSAVPFFMASKAAGFILTLPQAEQIWRHLLLLTSAMAALPFLSKCVNPFCMCVTSRLFAETAVRERTAFAVRHKPP
jgi:hypothetical protein